MSAEIIQNYGILTSISWNSNNWSDEPTEEDLKASNYEFVKGNARMHESLNFGHEKFPLEDDGYYIAYSPILKRFKGTENSKNVSIIFFISSDYKNSNRKSIVGFYGNPYFGEIYYRNSQHDYYEKYDSGNISSLPEDIIYFNHPVLIDNITAAEQNLLPLNKMISSRGFNYLNSDNVLNLLRLAFKLNPTNTKLKNFVDRFPLWVEQVKESSTLRELSTLVENGNPHTIEGIAELEKKMKNLSPEVKERVSYYIERGTIANKVKKITNYKCLVCDAINVNPISFTKRNGNPYVETHHVEQVTTLKKGVLSIDNLITVCANHHRQLHYGNSSVVSQDEEFFTFEIDGKEIRVPKIKVN